MKITLSILSVILFVFITNFYLADKPAKYGPTLLSKVDYSLKRVLSIKNKRKPAQISNSEDICSQTEESINFIIEDVDEDTFYWISNNGTLGYGGYGYGGYGYGGYGYGGNGYGGYGYGGNGYGGYGYGGNGYGGYGYSGYQLYGKDYNLDCEECSNIISGKIQIPGTIKGIKILLIETLLKIDEKNNCGFKEKISFLQNFLKQHL